MIMFVTCLWWSILCTPTSFPILDQDCSSLHALFDSLLLKVCRVNWSVKVRVKSRSSDAGEIWATKLEGSFSVAIWTIVDVDFATTGSASDSMCLSDVRRRNKQGKHSQVVPILSSSSAWAFHANPIVCGVNFQCCGILLKWLCNSRKLYAWL